MFTTYRCNTITNKTTFHIINCAEIYIDSKNVGDFMDYESIYSKFLTPIRAAGVPPIKNVIASEEFVSDRSRIIYSSYFRTLQQKTQVFPLEMNRTVRTRLVHSLEVSDIGRTLSKQIVKKLHGKFDIPEKIIAHIPDIVECACLIHDIGNPPFGHFGETAIKEWFFYNWENYALKAGVDIKRGTKSNERFRILLNDLVEFDGNQQSVRVSMRLKPGSVGYPMNLTYQTVLSMIKYPFSTSEYRTQKGKKAGFFEVEREAICEMFGAFGIESGRRYPFSYITEAADDLAYCMSDIDDGIEKRLITAEEFNEEFKKTWLRLYPKQKKDGHEQTFAIPVRMPRAKQKYNFGQEISAKWTKHLIKEISDAYIMNHEKILDGSLKALIDDNSNAGRVLNTLKTMARTSLYTAHEVVSLELAGFRAISGLLEHYSKILLLTKSQFGNLVCHSKNQGRTELDIEWRIFNKIARRFVATYKNSVMHNVSESISEENFEECFSKIDSGEEWIYRAHMVIDHIVCMTDDYAVAQYRLLSGIL